MRFRHIPMVLLCFALSICNAARSAEPAQSNAATADASTMQVPPAAQISMQQRVGDLLNSTKPLAKRAKTAMADAKDDNARVLVVLADPTVEAAVQFYEALYTCSDGRFRSAVEAYELLWVKASNPEDVSQAARELSIDLNGVVAPSVVVLDDNGAVLGHGPLSLERRGNLEIIPLRDLLIKYLLPKPDSEKLLADALVQAKNQNKRVLLQESGTWCIPCHRLSRFIEAHREVFDANYVWLRIDGAATHSADVIQRLRRKWGSIPWIAILDSNGTVLGTSDKDELNFSVPSDAAQIELLIDLLKSTTPQLSEDQVRTVRRDLGKINDQ